MVLAESGVAVDFIHKKSWQTRGSETRDPASCSPDTAKEVDARPVCF